MRVFNSEYEQFVQSSNKSSRWAIQVAFDDAATDFVYFTSHDDVPIPAGETVVHGVLRNISAVLQQLKPAKFNSTIGNLSFSLVNVSGNVESELRAKRALGIHLFGKRARLFSGAVGLQWGSYIIETTQWISSEFDYRKNQYLVSCKDSQSLMDKTVNRPPETRLSASVAPSDLTFSIYNSSEFNLVQQDLLFVEAPNELCTFIEISDNNQKEFCKVTAITATELTVVRGVMGTTAFGWAVPNNADEDRGPKIKEMFTIDMNMAKFAWAFLTGEDLDNLGVNLFPEGRHCGVPTNQLVRQEFIDLQAENATKAQHMALKKVNGKQFFEEQIALSLGYYLGVNGDGLMNLRSLNSVHSNNNVVGTIGQNEMVDFSSLKHDASEVANFINMFWSWDERPNKPEYRRKATFVIKNSKTQFGEKPLSVFLQLLNASTSTSSTLLAIANRYMSRYAGDSVNFSCKTLRKQARFETGDIINVEHPSIADYTGNGSLGRAMQIIGKSISQSKGITFKFFGSSLVADPITDGDVRAMADGYYDSAGQVIPNVSANSLTTETTLVGGIDIHAAANIYYHLGDLNLSSKLNIEQNVQLRVRGFITGTEFINCVGNGRAGGGGYIGTSIGKSGSDEYIDFTGWDASYEVNGDVNTGQHDAFPVLTLDNLDGTIINGIPSDLRGSAGASGGDSLYENNQTNESESSSGATGNDSGSGLMIVCRGMSLSGNANIDMSGVEGNVAVDSVPNGFAVGGNGGHSTPGGILILLDGGTSSVPNINGRITALSNDPSYDVGMDIGQSVARIQFIPKARVPVEDDPIDDSSIALYTWIKFADDAVGAGLTDDPTGKAYLGIAVNQAVQAEGTNAAVYTWSKILGDDGNDGVGQDGADGQTTYTWVKYADDGAGAGLTNDPTNKDYIGLAFNKTTATESTIAGDYTWSLYVGSDGVAGANGVNGNDGLQGLQGDDGADGIAGTNGVDGTSTYFHIAYADTITGTGFSQNSAGKLYIGTYVDSIVADALSGSALWNWQLVVGSDGANGTDGSDGIAGTNGDDGQTSYLHIAYANDSAGSTGFSTTNSVDKFYIGQYTDFVLADSNTAGDYSWTLIKGADGQPGSNALNDGRRANDLSVWFSGVASTVVLAPPWSVVAEASAPIWPEVIRAEEDNGTTRYMFSNKMAVTANQKYRVSIQARQPSGDRRNYLMVSFQDSAGVNIHSVTSDATGWGAIGTYHYYGVINDVFSVNWGKYDTEFGGGATATIPSNAVTMSIGGLFLRDGAVGTNTVVEWQDLHVVEVANNGQDGIDGLQGNDGSDGIAGTNGVDGTSTYFHIAYADTITGTGFSQNSAGKLYIGTYVDSIVADALSGSALWNWQLVVGSDGANGTDGSDGIAGTNGDDGQTSYLHIAYANNSTGSSGFSTTNSVDKFYIGQYTDFTLADSNTAGDYSWSLIRGADGQDGADGSDGLGANPILNSTNDPKTGLTHISVGNGITITWSLAENSENSFNTNDPPSGFITLNLKRNGLTIDTVQVVDQFDSEAGEGYWEYGSAIRTINDTPGVGTHSYTVTTDQNSTDVVEASGGIITTREEQ